MTETNASTFTPTIAEAQVALLERLCNATGVTGEEREVRAIILEQVRELADEVKIDPLGSVYAIRHAKTENPLRVMLDAHMDEIGFLIVSDDENGLYRFVKIGGIDDRQLPGKTVLVGKDNLPGVIGAKAIHLTEPGETDNKISSDSLRIDIGPGGGNVKVGDRATFATRFRTAGPSFIAKALDNRLGCATLIEILRAAKESDALDHIELLVAFSVQEEIGGRGARVAAYALEPDVAVAVDSTPANDLPMFDAVDGYPSENQTYNTQLGRGPAIYVTDSSTLSDPRLVRHFFQTGEARGIPFQVRQPGGGGTDAGTIHRTRAGVPSISVSIPGRYAHTAAAVVRRADWENTLALLWHALAGMQRGLVEVERK